MGLTKVLVPAHPETCRSKNDVLTFESNRRPAQAMLLSTPMSHTGTYKSSLEPDFSNVSIYPATGTGGGDFIEFADASTL